MKYFNIAKSHFRLNDHYMGIGEVYGKFIDNRGRELIYRINDFERYTKNVECIKYIEIGNEVIEQIVIKKYHYYKLYVWNDVAEHWEKYRTDYKPLRKLGSYLEQMFKKCGIDKNTKVVKYVDNTIVGVPKLKEAQSEYMYKIVGGYAVSGRVMTNGNNGFYAYSNGVCNRKPCTQVDMI